MLRLAVTWGWWCAGLFPFACLAALCALAGGEARALDGRSDLPAWLLPVGVAGLILSAACGWQWTRPRSPSLRVEVARALLLALPASYLPALLGLPLGELRGGFVPATPVPAAFAVWATVYALCAGAIFMTRTAPPSAPLAEA